jgi:hypothetical protein
MRRQKENTLPGGIGWNFVSSEQEPHGVTTQKTPFFTNKPDCGVPLQEALFAVCREANTRYELEDSRTTLHYGSDIFLENIGSN